MIQKIFYARITKKQYEQAMISARNRDAVRAEFKKSLRAKYKNFTRSI